MKTCTTTPVPQAKIKNIYLIFYINNMKLNCEEWWRWRESNPLHHIRYKYLILLINIIQLKYIMGQV